ncbi:MAG: hypothetical protein D3916_11745, partial [Candidatus Electrothrix sp. MAN1_4]|nr:hypothetical protein [Candidatus Electrothrix sp. MAN1_4]
MFLLTLSYNHLFLPDSLLLLELMKRKLFWLCCFCCLCLIGSLFYFFLRPVPPDSPQSSAADFLPEETLALVSLHDMEGLSEVFPATPLGRFLAKPVMQGMMQELGATDEDLDAYAAFYDSIAGVMASTWFRQFFGDDAALALWQPDLERLHKSPEQALKNSLLVFGTSTIAGPFAKLARIVLWNNVSNTEIAGLQITRIQLDDEEVLYGYDDQGIILLAYDPQRIVAALQQKAIVKNLKHLEAFGIVERFWEREQEGHIYVHSYFNLPLLHEILSVFTPHKDWEGAKGLSGVKSMGGVVINTGKGLRVRVQGEADPEKLSQNRQDGDEGTHEKIISSLVQEKTLIHYRISDFDKAFFRGFFPSKKEYGDLQKTVQEELGFSLDKFLEALGPQAGVSMHELVNAGIFPLPKNVFAFQVQNKKAVGWSLRKLRDALKKQGVTEHYEKVQGHRLYYWSRMPIEATHLTLALTDTMLYIANGESQLRTLLAEKQVSESLTENMVRALGKTAGTCVATAK